MTDTLDGGPGLEVDAFAAFTAGLGQVRDELAAHRALLQDALPIDAALSATGTYPSSGSLGIDLGGPSMGRVWLLRRLAVGGLTWGTAAAGSLEVYATGLIPTQVAAARPLADLVDVAAALPYRATYASRQVVLVYPQRLVAVVVGGTAAQEYAASGAAEDYSVRTTRKVGYEL